MKNADKWLKRAFLLGAFIDGLAAVAMLWPALVEPVWGLRGLGAEFRFAMGYGASLMLGWTGLLFWAARRPLERRGVALLTAVPVLAGLVLTEAWAIATGLVRASQLMPMMPLQLVGMVALSALYQAARAEQ